MVVVTAAATVATAVNCYDHVAVAGIRVSVCMCMRCAIDGMQRPRHRPTTT